MTGMEPLAPLATAGRRIETAIIGGGQAGLAEAYWLRRAGRECVVFEARKRVGDQWRERYDSLRLFTPAWADGLPGMTFPAPRSSWPTAREVADYLEGYADMIGGSLWAGVRVDSVEMLGDGSFVISTTSGQWHAQNVVVATGSDAAPKIPEVASQLDPGIRQLHSSQYRNPAQLLPGPVLVVGASQSGADLALEAAQAGHETWLSGRHPGELPVNERIAGPFFWFAQNYVLTLKTPIGQKLRPVIRHGGSPLIRTKRADLDRAGVHRTPARTTASIDGRPTLDDGTVLDVANVLWCTGYLPSYAFIHPAVIGPDGYPTETQGVAADVPGLFYLGLVFQRGFYSHLLGGVGRDAKFIAQLISERALSRNTVAA
ncbi:flavin-containing monooxygenase [Sinomonas terrae]|uniref:NAD(P)/FAD-dependent oxidoreductase n=1 Tax=Sinomonas terrae TaxID=2908838 RepID=A0ABS9U4C2_9MICC|nr:NAD(P)/FAD-dependent oxidoreductase [Sinomonas terrae]MCH6471538.1 NAD(P)/FAD-dependent oxidoreductase [Sinomonas terrae]